MNNDGYLDSNESTLSGIPVRLYNSEGIVVKQVTSDVNGHYHFDDVFPGSSHTVGVVAGNTYHISDYLVVGGNQMTQFTDEMGVSQGITLDEGGHRSDVHGGVWKPIEIGNR